MKHASVAKVSNTGRMILAAVSNGIADPDQIGTKLNLRAGRTRSIEALRRGKLLKFEPVTVKQLVLTEAGKAVLQGGEEGGEAPAEGGGRRSVAGKPSKREHADAIIASSPRSMSRGELIAKLVEDVGLTAFSASTYIYNWGQKH